MITLYSVHNVIRLVIDYSLVIFAMIRSFDNQSSSQDVGQFWGGVVSQSHRRSAKDFQSFQNFYSNKHMIRRCNLRQPAASSYDSRGPSPHTRRVRRGRYHKRYPEIEDSEPRLSSNWSMMIICSLSWADLQSVTDTWLYDCMII